MVFKILCSKCEEHYKVTKLTTVLDAPTIETTCPFCGNYIKKNIAAFLEKQITRKHPNRAESYHWASEAIKIARAMEKELK